MNSFRSAIVVSDARISYENLYFVSSICDGCLSIVDQRNFLSDFCWLGKIFRKNFETKQYWIFLSVFVQQGEFSCLFPINWVKILKLNNIERPNTNLFSLTIVLIYLIIFTKQNFGMLHFRVVYFDFSCSCLLLKWKCN